MRISVVFRPKQEETVPNLTPKAKKSKDAVTTLCSERTTLCTDSRNITNQVKIDVQILARQLLKMSKVVETEAETVYQ